LLDTAFFPVAKHPACFWGLTAWRSQAAAREFFAFSLTSLGEKRSYRLYRSPCGSRGALVFALLRSSASSFGRLQQLSAAPIRAWVAISLHGLDRRVP
jgi:hypothetical protein